MSVTIYRWICIKKRAGAFIRPMGTEQVPKPIKNIGAFVRYDAPVCLCVYTHWCRCTTYGHCTNTDTNYKSQCSCLILCLDAFVWPMGTAWIPIPIINLGSFLWYGAPVPHKDTRTGALIRPMGTAQIPRPIRTAPCIVSPTPGPVVCFR